MNGTLLGIGTSGLLFRIKIVFAAVVCVAGFMQPMHAQAPSGSLLQIDISDETVYVLSDVEFTQLGTNFKPGPIPGSAPAPFKSVIGIGDIGAVNGTPVKGTAFQRITTIQSRPNLISGRAIADVTRGDFQEWTLELMNQDGTLIGSMFVTGMGGGGPPPPGAPRAISASGLMIIGGTGPFLGARGYMAEHLGGALLSLRAATAAEDPANRRINGGGSGFVTLYVIPQTRPEILTSAAGPVIVHAVDFTPVTTSKPARPGELLTLYASGLGPTRPGVDPGEVFTSDPLQVVSSPVQALVNGIPGDVLYAGGEPGTADIYQVNFRVPEGTASGQASVQLTTAWIAGGQVKMAIQ